MDIEQAMIALDQVVQDQRFMAFQQDFIGRHCHLFEEQEENRLEWTTIHQDYERTIEQHLESELQSRVPGFSMAALQESLPAYIEAKRDVQEGHAATLDLLVTFGDFEAFKALMLEAKRSAASPQDQGLAPHSPMVPPSVAEAMEQCREMATCGADPAAGWVQIQSKPWMTIDRLKRPGSNDVCRITIDLEMPANYGLDMMMNITEERKQWDANSTITVLEEYGPNDRLLDWTMKIPMIPAMKYRIRNVLVQDFPAPGCFTGVYVAPNLEDPTNEKKPEGLGNYIIVPTEKGCRLTSIEEIPPSLIPSFMMNWMISTMAPRWLNSMIEKYKKVKGPFC